EAERMAERLGDDRRRGQLCISRATMHNHRGQLNEAVEVGARAMEIAGTLGDTGLRIGTSAVLAQTHWSRGEFGLAVDLANAGLSLVPAESSHELFWYSSPASVTLTAWLVMSLAERGQFDEAAAPAAAAIQIAEGMHHPHSIVWAHRAAGQFQIARGDWATARLRYERAIEVAREGQMGLDL